MQDATAPRYGPESLLQAAEPFLAMIRRCPSAKAARHRLYEEVSREQYYQHDEAMAAGTAALRNVRDAARALRSMLNPRAEQQAGFPIAGTLWDIASGRIDPSWSPAFFAETTHLFLALTGRARLGSLVPGSPTAGLEGREAARERSDRLDLLWQQVQDWMARYPHGLSAESLERRARREQVVAAALGGSPEDFEDWHWQVGHVLADAASLARVMRLLPEEREAIQPLADHRIPFGVTPYYASLMDDDPEAGRDRALRAQVLPPGTYVREMIFRKGQRHCAFDFMLERNTSPIDLVTRRYPAIAILKPFNTCPQVCVYCQRNWEIDQPMAPGALASPQVLDEAIGWIRKHPSIREVLVTGGDPLGLPDDPLMEILGKVAAIPHVDLIRIGTRTPVTLPMRITETLAAGLGSLREPGRREVCVVTHVQHPYEVTPRMVLAVDRLRRQGIPVFNQMVFTLFVSRRFEASALRMLLRRIGIEPYYTFLPKGKEELDDYRVPIARLVQEQAEEARLLPGSRRTDEAVYNVPSLGKNYLRAMQHRDLLSILPDGSRVYSFHPWEMGIAPSEPYIGRDVPLLDYLERLRGIGEDPGDYESLWYYY